MSDYIMILGVVCMHAQSCPTLCNPMNCSLPGFTIREIFQARILEWVLQGNFPTQGSHPLLLPRFLHWQADSLPLHQLIIIYDCISFVYQVYSSSTYGWYIEKFNIYNMCDFVWKKTFTFSVSPQNILLCLPGKRRACKNIYIQYSLCYKVKNLRK